MTLPARLFGEGFRVFFLAAGIFGLIAVLWWGLWLADLVALPPSAAAPSTLHGHEMIFGYAAAAMGGFFLTAVPNWTGAPAARSLFIAAVAGLWLAGRGASASPAKKGGAGCEGSRFAASSKASAAAGDIMPPPCAASALPSPTHRSTLSGYF